MLSLYSIAEQIVDLHIVAQKVKSHKRALRMFGFGENAHAVGQIGIQHRRHALLGIEYAHVPFRMLSRHLGIETLCRVCVAQRQCRLSRLEALCVVLGIYHRVLAPESPVSPVFQTLDDALEQSLVIISLYLSIVVKFAYAAH